MTVPDIFFGLAAVLFLGTGCFAQDPVSLTAQDAVWAAFSRDKATARAAIDDAYVCFVSILSLRSTGDFGESPAFGVPVSKRSATWKGARREIWAKIRAQVLIP